MTLPQMFIVRSHARRLSSPVADVGRRVWRGHALVDDAEFRNLLLAQLDAVFRLACHLTRGRQEADDLVQETYLRALRSSGTFTLGALGVRPWLFKILHNVIYTRGAKLTREHEILADHAASMNGSIAGVPASESAIDWDNIDERLKAAIDELALPYRAAFLLSAVEGLKYREIADVTEVPIGTVMSRLSRARVALAERLRDLAAEQGLGQSINSHLSEKTSQPKS